jgi:hypothetical protein
MSSRTNFWIVIIALNGAIWLAFVRTANTRSVLHGSSQANPTDSRLEARPKPIRPIVIRTNAFDWGQLEAEDYRTYITRLRDIGCPEETIRDIIIADLQKLMAPRVQQIDGPKEPARYWKPQRKELVPALASLQKLEQKQELDFEQREIVRELLGIDLAAERNRAKGETDFYEERLGFLLPEKSSRVRMIMERANREEVFLREKSWLENDTLTPDEKKQLREIEKRKDVEIASLLSPDEREQYNLWFSPSAYKVREGFLTLEPTEDEFLALYRIQREFDEQWQDVEPASLSPEQKAKFEQSRFKAEQMIRDHLGPERYEQYQRSRDPDFQQLRAAAAEFALPAGAASDVYSFKQVLLEERTRVKQNATLSSAQKEQILLALSQETEGAIIQVMGPKAYRYYLRTGSGRWIRE